LRISWKAILPASIISVVLAVIVLISSQAILATLSTLVISFILTLGITAAYLRYVGDNSSLLSAKTVVTEQPPSFSASKYYEETEPETARLPVVTEEIDGDNNTQQEKPRRSTRRTVELISGTDNQYRLTANTWLRQRPPLWAFWQKSTWHCLPRSLMFEASPLIDIGKVRRVRFDILDRENRLIYFRRLHWWIHGPKQIGVSLLWLLVTIMLIAGILRTDVNAASGLLLTLMLWLAAFVAVTVRIWFRWFFTYLIVTDKRLILHYNPPILPKVAPELLLANVTNTSSKDQSIIGKRLHFGKLLADVPGFSDEWAHMLEYVVYVHELKATLTEQVIS
jgi:hypothetical protein